MGAGIVHKRNGVYAIEEEKKSNATYVSILYERFYVTLKYSHVEFIVGYIKIFNR